jgi:hypothetical protein
MGGLLISTAGEALLAALDTQSTIRTSSWAWAYWASASHEHAIVTAVLQSVFPRATSSASPAAASAFFRSGRDGRRVRPGLGD